MLKLIMLKGLPASGKTTWAKEQVRKSNGKVKRVNKDDLRMMIDDGQWSKTNEHIILLMRNQIIMEALKEHCDIIVDDTNLDPKHESLLRKFAADLSAEFNIMDFDTPLEECIARDAKREKPVGEKVIRDMYNRYLAPKDPRGIAYTVAQKPGAYVHNPELPKAIICDIDGTLAHMDGKRGPYDWHKVGGDSCDEQIRDILIEYSNRGSTIIIMSGREDVCRPETEAWLKEHNIPYNFIFMRKAGDKRKDSIIKEELFSTAINGDFCIQFVLDDRLQVVQMWRSLGLKCLQVAEGNF